MCSSTGRERPGWPSGWAMPMAAVDGEMMAQSCRPVHSPRGAGMGSATAPFLSIFPMKGWSDFGSKGRKGTLSSACARRGVYQGCQHCHEGRAFLALNTIFSTSLYASSCGEVRWAAISLHQAGQGPVYGALQQHGTGQDSGDTRQDRGQWTGQAGMWVLGERVRQNKERWCLSADNGCTRGRTPSLFPDKPAPLHHPGRAGRVPSATVGKCLFYQPEHRDIVSHCFLVNAGSVRGGSSVVGEETRGQGQKQLPALTGLSVRLGFGVSQTSAGNAGMGLSPALFTLIHSPWPQERPGMEPCLSILLPKFSRSKTPLASPGTVH